MPTLTVLAIFAFVYLNGLFIYTVAKYLVTTCLDGNWKAMWGRPFLMAVTVFAGVGMATGILPLLVALLSGGLWLLGL
jgi:hypothetical protein